MRIRVLAGLAVALAALAPVASADELSVGDKAPPLSVDKWVKGEPVEGFEPGKTYVVEFWATWCGPCRVSIPHLTELQKKYKDKASFIGVSVWEDDPSGVEPFVKDMGEKMDYRVATDKIPAGKSANDGAMAQAWMQSAGENGIPTAFIVTNGRIAWIGHPMSMDEPLEKVVSGDWDIEKAASERKAAKAREKKVSALIGKLQNAGSAKEAAALLPEIESLMAEDEQLAEQLGMLRFNLLLASNPDKAAAYAEQLAGKQFADNAMMLNNVAWMLIDPDAGREPTEKAAKTSLILAKKAVELAGDEPGHLDTLALAYYRTGDTAKALEVQEKAVRLAGDDVDAAMKDRLEMYRKAAKDGGKSEGSNK
jgi:thiol-disulfide isomerase/thioredoxin